MAILPYHGPSYMEKHPRDAVFAILWGFWKNPNSASALPILAAAIILAANHPYLLVGIL
jgi:hypothetical protein